MHRHMWGGAPGGAPAQAQRRQETRLQIGTVHMPSPDAVPNPCRVELATSPSTESMSMGQAVVTPWEVVLDGGYASLNDHRYFLVRPQITIPSAKLGKS